jgi:hypothetical protein
MGNIWEGSVRLFLVDDSSIFIRLIGRNKNVIKKKHENQI